MTWASITGARCGQITAAQIARTRPSPYGSRGRRFGNLPTGSCGIFVDEISALRPFHRHQPGGEGGNEFRGQPRWRQLAIGSLH
jgi:hypothetical protein